MPLFGGIGGQNDVMLLEVTMHCFCLTWPYIGAAMMSADMEREEQRRRWEQNESSGVERMEQQEEARQEKLQVGWFCQTGTGHAQHVTAQ